MVHGAGAAQALLQAGELDEMEIHLVPVVLGAGRSLFGTSEPGHELELVRRARGEQRHPPALPGRRPAARVVKRRDRPVV